MLLDLSWSDVVCVLEFLPWEQIMRARRVNHEWLSCIGSNVHFFDVCQVYTRLQRLHVKHTHALSEDVASSRYTREIKCHSGMQLWKHRNNAHMDSFANFHNVIGNVYTVVDDTYTQLKQLLEDHIGTCFIRVITKTFQHPFAKRFIQELHECFTRRRCHIHGISDILFMQCKHVNSSPSIDRRKVQRWVYANCPFSACPMCNTGEHCQSHCE
jgi:hypothetical protein